MMVDELSDVRNFVGAKINGRNERASVNVSSQSGALRTTDCPVPQFKYEPLQAVFKISSLASGSIESIYPSLGRANTAF